MEIHASIRAVVFAGALIWVHHPAEAHSSRRPERFVAEPAIVGSSKAEPEGLAKVIPFVSGRGRTNYLPTGNEQPVEAREQGNSSSIPAYFSGNVVNLAVQRTRPAAADAPTLNAFMQRLQQHQESLKEGNPDATNDVEDMNAASAQSKTTGTDGHAAAEQEEADAKFSEEVDEIAGQQRRSTHTGIATMFPRPHQHALQERLLLFFPIGDESPKLLEGSGVLIPVEPNGLRFAPPGSGSDIPRSRISVRREGQ